MAVSVASLPVSTLLVGTGPTWVAPHAIQVVSLTILYVGTLHSAPISSTDKLYG